MSDAQTKAMEEARARLAERMGDQARTGGKGSTRRKKKVAPKKNSNDDTKLNKQLSKFGLQ
jgi:hypothetical protein